MDLLSPLLRVIYRIKEYLWSFVSDEGLVPHLCYSLNNRIEPNCIELSLAIQITFALKKMIVELASQMTEMLQGIRRLC